MKSIEKILALKDPTEFAIAIGDLVLGIKGEFDDMPDAQKVVYCLNALESEVNNGGFEQFFFNSSGDTVPETVMALHAIGAKKCAGLVKKAIAFFPGGEPPRDWKKRRALLEKISDEVRDAWNELDQKFFMYPDDLTSLLRVYVTANKDQFGSKSGKAVVPPRKPVAKKKSAAKKKPAAKKAAGKKRRK